MWQFLITVNLLLSLLAARKIWLHREQYEWTAAAIVFALFWVFPILGPVVFLVKRAGVSN